ncbi:hypothetical protein [Cellulomonas sp. C5510]|uniref:hypothetical protein n=1 Tax=Cellulomonas sp. C5510 TaxID=2871170 RepID=UPI001C939348|nr:hypothetical protein [Cellulomonas sp. C5510]QZN86361.1 hypothetical protein K5O09_04075 [Cellulomonas sp. C5510]
MPTSFTIRPPRRVIAALLAVLLLTAWLTITTGSEARASDVGGPINRAEVLARAQFWVDRQVPYSQSASHPDPDGRLYRQDCSGMVSMAWHLGSSLSTRTLPNVSVRLGGFGELAPGDMLLRPGVHARIFAGWTDGSRTAAWVYEQPNWNLTARKTTYSMAAMAGQGYQAWRYTGIRDDAPTQAPVLPTTYDRVAVVDGSGSLSVKQGPLTGSWTTVASAVATSAVEGDRVAMLTTGGDLYVKEGESLTGTWTLVYRGVASFDLSGDRIGVVDTNGTVFVKDGPVSAPWVAVQSPGTQVALDAERVGVLDTQGTLWVKDGPLEAMWTKVATSVSTFDLGADRIAVVQKSGAVQVKEGAVTAGWTTVTTGGADVVLAGSRIGVLSTSGAVYVKDGPVTAQWVTLSTTKVELDLYDDRVAVRSASGQVSVKEGPLTAGWVTVTNAGATGVALG